MNGLQVAIFFFIISGGVLCYPGQLMDELPPTFQIRSQVLKIALAIDENWSPIFSEKLKPVQIFAQPKISFCMQLIPESNLNEAINVYQVIKDILNYCSFSGWYIVHGMHLLGHATKCFFQKHALAQLKTITYFLGDMTDEFKEYLQKLMKDYEVIADKLTVVGASLRHVFELVSFFDEILRGTSTDESELISKCKDLKTRISIDHGKFCAVPIKGKVWYDKPTIKYLDIDVTQEFEAQPEEPHESPKSQKPKVPQFGDTPFTSVSDDTPSTSDSITLLPESTALKRVLTKAERLRIIMIRTFEGLLIREMPPEFWTEVFNDNILITESDMQKVDEFEEALEGEMDTIFKLPWE